MGLAYFAEALDWERGGCRLILNLLLECLFKGVTAINPANIAECISSGIEALSG